MATRVYGQSDDLIEVDGDVTGEIGAYGSDDASEPNAAVVLNDGTVSEWTYDQGGIWRCKVLAKGTCFDRLEPCDGSHIDDDYSDILHLKDGVTRGWAARGALEDIQ